jgi:hypothetical protein
MAWEDPSASKGVLHGVDDIPIVVRSPAARALSHAFILLRLVGVLALVIIWRSTSGVEDPDDVTGPMKVMLEFFGTLFAVFGTWRFGLSRNGPRRQEVSEQIATEHGLGALPPEHQRDAVSPPLWWLIVPATASIFLVAGTVALTLVSDLQGTDPAQALLVATGYAVGSVGLALLVNLGWLALGARLTQRPVTYLER